MPPGVKIAQSKAVGDFHNYNFHIQFPFVTLCSLLLQLTQCLIVKTTRPKFFTAKGLHGI